MEKKKYFLLFLLLFFAGKINNIYLQTAGEVASGNSNNSLPIPIIENPATAYQYLTTGIVFAAGYIVYKVLMRVLDSNDRLADALDKLALSNTVLTNKVDTLTNKVDKMDDDIAALRQQK